MVAYLIMFALAFGIEFLGTAYVLALQRKQVRTAIVISLVEAVVGWAPIFFVLYADDIKLFPFAVAGQSIATVVALRMGKLKV